MWYDYYKRQRGFVTSNEMNLVTTPGMVTVSGGGLGGAQIGTSQVILVMYTYETAKCVTKFFKINNTRYFRAHQTICTCSTGGGAGEAPS